MVGRGRVRRGGSAERISLLNRIRVPKTGVPGVASTSHPTFTTLHARDQYSMSFPYPSASPCPLWQTCARKKCLFRQPLVFIHIHQRNQPTLQEGAKLTCISRRWIIQAPASSAVRESRFRLVAHGKIRTNSVHFEIVPERKRTMWRKRDAFESPGRMKRRV
jgi:hypothetical protein